MDKFEQHKEYEPTSDSITTAIIDAYGLQGNSIDQGNYSRIHDLLKQFVRSAYNYVKNNEEGFGDVVKHGKVIYFSPEQVEYIFNRMDVAMHNITQNNIYLPLLATEHRFEPDKNTLEIARCLMLGQSYEQYLTRNEEAVENDVDFEQ